MIQLREHEHGTILPIRAQPGARRDELRGEQDGRLKVCVTQAPEKGKANKAIIVLLAKQLAVRKSQLSLVSGETSSQKDILIEGVSPDQLRARITAL